METLDGKDTLHATVGHTYQNVLQDDLEASSNPIAFRKKRNRQSFAGNEREIPAFKKSLSSAKFVSPTAVSTANCADTASTSTSQNTGDRSNEKKLHLNVLDLY